MQYYGPDGLSVSQRESFITQWINDNVDPLIQELIEGVFNEAISIQFGGLSIGGLDVVGLGLDIAKSQSGDGFTVTTATATAELATSAAVVGYITGLATAAFGPAGALVALAARVGIGSNVNAIWSYMSEGLVDAFETGTEFVTQTFDHEFTITSASGGTLLGGVVFKQGISDDPLVIAQDLVARGAVGDVVGAPEHGARIRHYEETLFSGTVLAQTFNVVSLQLFTELTGTYGEPITASEVQGWHWAQHANGASATNREVFAEVGSTGFSVVEDGSNVAIKIIDENGNVRLVSAPVNAIGFNDTGPESIQQVQYIFGNGYAGRLLPLVPAIRDVVSDDLSAGSLNSGGRLSTAGLWRGVFGGASWPSLSSGFA